MAIVEGTTSLPAVQGVAAAGWYDGTNLWLPRADAGHNLKVAFYAADGTTALLVAANPGVVNLTQVNGVALLAGAGNTGTGSPRVTIASDQAVLPFKVDQTTPGTTNQVQAGDITTISAVPTISSSPAYSSGDALGGKITLASAVRVSGGSGIVENLKLSDLGKQNGVVYVVFFKADPSGTTFTDNAVLDIADADMSKCIGHVKIEATDYASFNDNSVAAVKAIGLAFKLTSGTSLYACLLSGDTKTYTSTSDLELEVGILQT